MSDDDVKHEHLARLILGGAILVLAGILGYGAFVGLRAVQHAITNWHVWGPRIVGVVGFVVLSYLVGSSFVYVLVDDDE